ncbi:MAG: hypothetical protein Athens101428_265 [Candidatus Berkelbacteria bacterium Athens1014_28]|uniref:Uncharacterized protein n=1 Tax=Candidatus Berkelbacteria bacterium Athens1014_28 TaxID=2017145 RepID=A0A554LNQ8_9BACT|nr:MAG: hypothetical protein Athens101428_265 [Candidatus Berkelbacteria bacterium Athens1014_28]
MSLGDILHVVQTETDPNKILEIRSEIADLSVADKRRLVELAEKVSVDETIESETQNVAQVAEIAPQEAQDIVAPPEVPAEVAEVDEEIAKVVETVPEVVTEENSEEAVLPADNQPTTAVDTRTEFVSTEEPPTTKEAADMEERFFAD